MNNYERFMISHIRIMGMLQSGCYFFLFNAKNPGSWQKKKKWQEKNINYILLFNTLIGCIVTNPIALW